MVFLLSLLFASLFGTQSLTDLELPKHSRVSGWQASGTLTSASVARVINTGHVPNCPHNMVSGDWAQVTTLARQVLVHHNLHKFIECVLFQPTDRPWWTLTFPKSVISRKRHDHGITWVYIKKITYQTRHSQRSVLKMAQRVLAVLTTDWQHCRCSQRGHLLNTLCRSAVWKANASKDTEAKP